MGVLANLAIHSPLLFALSLNCDRGSQEPRYRGIYIDCDVPRLIQRIYISPLAPPFFCEAVRAVAERFGLSLPIDQSDLASKPLY